MKASVVLLVLRRELRRRVGALVGLALVMAIGGGVTIGALAAAYRTDRVYGDYVRHGEVTDLVVNPSVSTRAIAASIRHLPDVRTVHTDSLFLASVQQTEPARFRKFSESNAEQSLQVRGSTDGRYEAVDRPVVTEGRFASGQHEIFVTEDYRSDLESSLGRDLKVGDTIKIAFWWAYLDTINLPPDTIVKPIGVERLRIAGFGRLPDEMLPDELYPRQRLVVSADVARRYSCAGDLRADMTMDQAVAALIPRDCAVSYKYFALQLKDRPGSRVAVRRGFAKAAARLGHDVPADLTGAGISYYYVSQDRNDLDREVRQVTRPTVAALAVFGLVAGIATLSIVALAIGRLLRRNGPDQATVRALGASRGQRALIGAASPLVAAAAGMVGAIIVGFGASIAGPTGSVRAIAPSAGFALPLQVLLATVALMGGVLLAFTAALAWRAANRVGRTRESSTRRPWVSRVLGDRGRPATAQGIGAALATSRSDGAAVVLAGCVVAVAVVVSAVIFVANLNALVQQPARYGWPWDVAVITGAGYGDTDPGKVAASLRGDAAVADYALFTFDSSSNIAGHPVPTVYGFAGAERTRLQLVEGRQVEGAGEAVLGASTARDLHVSVGDRVPVRGPVAGLKTARVVGLGVLPSLGSFLSARTGLGTGAFVRIDTDPADPKNQYPAALTAIRLRPGSSVKSFVSGIKPAVRRWDVFGAAPYVHTTPVRPPEIVNAQSMRAAPLALGSLLALGLAIGLAYSIGVSVRDRRRELAILRSLGFSGRDLRATIAWQAIAIIVVGLVVGVPLGLIGGRFAWEQFASQLGVVTRADIPVAWLAAVVLAAFLIALVAAWSPARAAARIAPSLALNDRT